MKLCKARPYTAGEGKPDEREPVVKDIRFKVHQFTPRKRPDPKNVVVFPIFAEFGCESMAAVYCLPKMLERTAGRYTIVIGWAGRAYFYRHLVDEFWELDEEYMWLREYARAFHNVSTNIRRLEKEASKVGRVIKAAHLGNVAVFPELRACVKPECCSAPVFPVADKTQVCTSCRAAYPEVGLFARLPESKSDAKWLPDPSPEKMELVQKYIPDNPVAITARKRKTWGRNLDAEFYKRLIELLEGKGYNPVWVGEKSTSLPCPVPHIVDYSVTEDANDLETTLALIKQMRFTVQFWTASTRLAALMGTPYLIFESPDQIWGNGQEGMRLELLSRGPRKLVVSHYRRVLEDENAALLLVDRAVNEIELGDFSDIIGLVESSYVVRSMKEGKKWRM